MMALFGQCGMSCPDVDMSDCWRSQKGTEREGPQQKVVDPL